MSTSKENRTKQKDMGFGLVAAGFVFLVNPVFHVIDVLPDFIGFFLIWKGLSRLSAVEYDLESSRNLIKWLVITELIKPFTVVLVRGSGTAGINTPDNLLPVVHDNTKLLLTFVFSVIELIIFIPAMSKMFSGLDRLGIRFSSKSLNATENRKTFEREGKSLRIVDGKRDVSRKVFGVILLFYIVRVMFTFVCELPALQMYENSGFVDNRTLDLTRFKNLFYIFSSVIVMVFGVVFLYFTLRFFGNIRRDSEFIGKLNGAYSEYMGRSPHAGVASTMNVSAVFFVIGMLYTVMLFTSSGPRTAGALCAVFVVIAAVLFFRRKNMRTYAAVAALLAVVYCVLSFLDAHFANVFYVVDGYGLLDPLHFSEAAKEYYAMVAVETAEFLIIGASFFLFTFAYYKTVLKDIDRLGVEGVFSGLPTYSSAEYRAALPKSVKIRATVTLCLGIANFLFEASFKLYIFFPDFLAWLLPALYMFFCVAWIISMVEFYRFAHVEIYYPLSDGENRRKS